MTDRGETQVTDDLSPATRWTLPLTWLAALTVYLLLTSLDIVSGRNAAWLSDAAWTLAVGLAASATLRTSQLLIGNQRRAWQIFGVACLVWLAGQLIWDWNELVRGIDVPFPTVGDFGFIAFGITFGIGLFFLRASHGVSRLSPQRLANLGLIVCSIAFALFALVLHPIGRTAHGDYFVGTVVLESLSAAAAFVLAVYFMWSYRWGRDLPPLVLITLGLLCQTISVLIYAHELLLDEYSAANVINVGWLAAFGFQHWAAVVQSRIARNLHPQHQQPAARTLHRDEGWIEALAPGLLLLLIALSLTSLESFPSPIVVLITAALLGIYAAILAYREAWMHARGQQLRATLQRSTAELDTARLELAKMAEQHQELEREIELTTRAGGVGLWDWDIPSDTVHFSREWKRQLGYGDHEHELANESKEWRQRLHPDDYERVTTAVRNSMRLPRNEFTLETRLRHRDGSYRWILSQSTVMRDGNGSIVRMLGSHVDITARKEIESALRESEARYRELVDALELRVAARTADLTEAYRESRSFAYAVAHDLKSPLRAIDSFSHLLQESVQSKLTEAETGYIGRVRRGAIHMASLIDGLLDYSRLEHFEVRIEPLELPDFITALVKSSLDDTGSGNAHVDVDVPVATISADRQGLAVVMRNLLENAIKFTRNRSGPRVEIRGRVEEHTVVLWVRDNGIGFEQIYHEKIFEIFQRLHRNDEYEGTGIGLALVRKAMQRMKGRIWAVSAPDAGATFYLELPLAKIDSAG